MGTHRWHRYTASESFQRILDRENAWVAHGDFLDSWYRSDKKDRLGLVTEPMPQASTQQESQWAALFATSVIQLCIIDGLLFPDWVKNQSYRLSEPWYPSLASEKMRQYLRETTPFIFALFNVFGGDDILSRV